MPTSRERLKKRKKIFVIALAALIFAEAGYILGTTGLIHLLPLRPKVEFTQIISFSKAYVLTDGNETLTTSPMYSDAYVYVVLYQPGVRLPDSLAKQIALDAAEKPIYILPIPIVSAPVMPQDFVESLQINSRNPVVILIYPLERLQEVQTWLAEVENKLGVRITGNVRIELINNEPKSIRSF